MEIRNSKPRLGIAPRRWHAPTRGSPLVAERNGFAVHHQLPYLGVVDGVNNQTSRVLTSKASGCIPAVGSVHECLAAREGRGRVSLLIDSDTHLFEPSGMWREY